MEPKTQGAEAAAAPAARHTRECFERQYIIELPENPYRSCICASEPADKGERLAAEPPNTDEHWGGPARPWDLAERAAQPPPPNIQWNPEPPRGVTPALDVERLAQAWHMTQRCVHGKGSGEPMQKPGYLTPDREVAADIIEEYNRLAGSVDSSAGLDDGR